MRRVWLTVMVVVLAACPPASIPDGGLADDAGTGQLLLVFDGDFGEVERFTTGTNPARFVNVGEVPAGISRLSVAGEGFSIGAFDDAPILPGRFRDVPVLFRPTRNGAHAARISFQATTLPVLASFSMRGTGVGALVQVPDQVDLGSFGIDDFQTLRVDGVLRVENVGDRWLHFPSATAWRVEPAEELCVGDLDAQGRCTGLISSVDVAAGIAPGRALELPLHFISTVPGARRWTVSIQTTLPETPAFQVPVRIDVQPASACRLVASETTLDFGDVEAAHRSERSFTLQNVGGASCTGLEPRFATVVRSFGVVSPTTWPRTLASRESMVVTVRTQPASEGVVLRDTLTLGSLSLPVLVNAVQPCVSVQLPDDLGAWSASCAAPSGRLTLINRCTNPVTVTSLTSSSPNFRVVSATPLPAPVTVGASLEAELQVVNVENAGEVRSTLTIAVATDLRDERIVRDVRAQLVNGRVTQQQHALKKVDVLVVFDQQTTTALTTRQQLGTLYSQLVDSGVEFQLGAVASNPGRDGSLVASSSGRRWLTRTNGSDAEFLARLTGQSAAPGTAVARFLEARSAPKFVESSSNRGFFRPDATLVVLMISGANEGEQGQLEDLLSLIPDLRDVVAHVVEGCVSSSSLVQQRLVAATGGSLTSCSAPWAAVGEVLASVNGERRRMRVNSSVQPGSLMISGVDSSEWWFNGPWVTLSRSVASPLEATFSPQCR